VEVGRFHKTNPPVIPADATVAPTVLASYNAAMAESRPLAFVASRPVLDGALAAALRDDLVEVLQLLRLRLDRSDSAAQIAKAVAAHDAPSLVAFSDVPGLPPDCAEGALELAEEADVVIGPCADGGVYLLAFADGLEAAEIQSLIEAAMLADGLARVAGLLADSGLSVTTLPPWFRAVSDKDLSFAESLMRLSLMGEETESDFRADRLRLWFEKR
jgi:glycosyltransferase A (GT-A) superfamily protein (DUF2064 family)